MHTHLNRVTSGILFLLIGLAGCATPDQPDQAQAQVRSDLYDEVFESGAKTGPEQAAKPPQPPAEVMDALIPALPDRAGSAAAEDLRFDISVHRAPAREFFMGLVADTHYNMIVHPDVSGEISLDLKNVTIPDVIEAVQQVYGYEFKRSNAGFLVFPAEVRTRIYHVDYLNVLRTGASKTRVSSGQVSGNDSEKDDPKTEQVTGTEINTTSESNFWRDLQDTISALIQTSDASRVIVNRQSGMVVVRAFPAQLREVEELIQTIQKNVTRQVVLEAKILEVSLSDGFQSGINWAQLLEVGSDKSIVFGQTGGGTIFGPSSRGSSEISGNTGTLNPDNLSPVEGTDTSAFGGAFTIGVDLGDFTAFIELLKTQGDVHTLSSPRVSTLNNQKAVIKVGTDEFFVTDVSYSTSIGGSETVVEPDITLTPFFSGIALDVTPQIDEHGEVILHIHPSVTEVVDQTKSFTLGNEQTTLPLAMSNVRESDSIIRAKSGQIVVIGGLMQDRRSDRDAGTPVLKDLPLLGSLFKHQQQVVSKSELVILLKPSVVNAVVWGQTVDQTRQRFGQLSGDAR